MPQFIVEAADGERATVFADDAYAALQCFAERWNGAAVVVPQLDNPGWFGAWTAEGRVGHGIRVVPGFKVAVYVPGEAKPSYNALRFATREEAEAYGHDLLSRWLVPTRFEVEEATQ